MMPLLHQEDGEQQLLNSGTDTDKRLSMNTKNLKNLIIDNRHRIVYISALLFTTVWCGSIVCAPLFSEAGGMLQKISAVIVMFFAPICHQSPIRSFHIGGHPMAVCARCFGIYGGFLLGLIVYFFIRGTEEKTSPPPYLLIAAASPMILQIILSKFEIIPSTNIIRAVTGLLPGFISVCYIMPALNQLVDLKIKN